MEKATFTNDDNVVISLIKHPYSDCFKTRDHHEVLFRRINTFLIKNKMIKGDTRAVREALDKKQLEKNIRETKKLLGSPKDVVTAKFLVRETSSLSEFAKHNIWREVGVPVRKPSYMAVVGIKLGQQPSSIISNQHIPDVVAISPIDFVGKVNAYFSLIYGDDFNMAKHTRKKEYAMVRQLTHYCMRDLYPTLPLKRIGDVAGNKDHATVLHSIKVVKQGLEVKDKQIIALKLEFDKIISTCILGIKSWGKFNLKPII